MSWSPEGSTLWRGLVCVTPEKFWLRGEPTGEAARFFFSRFPPLANLRLGGAVVGVNQFLPARPAMRPENPGVTAARIPVDTALGDEDVIFGAGLFLAFPAAGVFVNLLLPFADGALRLRGQLGLQLGGGGGKFGILLGLLETEKCLGGCHAKVSCACHAHGVVVNLRPASSR